LIEIILDDFFPIAKFIIYGGIALCIYAAILKDKNKKNIRYDVMEDNTGIRENNFTNNNGNINKKSKVLTNVGITAIVVGIILLVLGVVSVIVAMYILILFFQFIFSLD